MAISLYGKSYKKYRIFRYDGKYLKCVRSYELARKIVDTSRYFKGFEVVRVYTACNLEVVESFVYPTIFVDASEVFGKFKM